MLGLPDAKILMIFHYVFTQKKHGIERGGPNVYMWVDCNSFSFDSMMTVVKENKRWQASTLTK